MVTFNLFNKKAEVKSKLPSEPNGDVSISERQDGGIFKAYTPNYLYKPPFGYPRPQPLPLIRQTAKSPYIYMIVKAICDAVATSEWEIAVKKDVEETDELLEIKKEIKNFFSNPNGNKESIGDIFRMLVKDILEIDSGILVKVFNEADQLSQIFARDGASFLKNPDIYGYMGKRADFVFPIDDNTLEVYGDKVVRNMYDISYKEQAAYFQYGATAGSMPVPFGRREIVWFSQNPISESIYGRSPVAILTDIIMTLVYGSRYNLDFYMNNNMPEGVMSVLGANTGQIKALKESFENKIMEEDQSTGFWRRVGFKVPWTSMEARFTPFQFDPKNMQVIEQQSWFTKIAWACFGTNADDMGFTENSNRAVSETQTKMAIKKSTNPIMKIIEYRLNQEIIPEFGTTDLYFKFCDFDLEYEIRKYELYQKKLNLGVITPEMIAEQEGLDVEKIKEAIEIKEEKESQEMNFKMNQAQVKSKDPFNDTDLEKALVDDIQTMGNKVKQALKNEL